MWYAMYANVFSESGSGFEIPDWILSSDSLNQWIQIQSGSGSYTLKANHLYIRIGFIVDPDPAFHLAKIGSWSNLKVTKSWCFQIKLIWMFSICIRIVIQIFISLRFQIRIQGAKPMRIRVWILVRFLSHKKFHFYMKNLFSWSKNISTKVLKPFPKTGNKDYLLILVNFHALGSGSPL